jgi:hypothetical protein
MQDSGRNTNTWSRFLEMLRKADSRRSRSDLDFYTRSAMPALLTMQSGSKMEQL